MTRKEADNQIKRLAALTGAAMTQSQIDARVVYADELWRNYRNLTSSQWERVITWVIDHYSGRPGTYPNPSYFRTAIESMRRAGKWEDRDKKPCEICCDVKFISAPRQGYPSQIVMIPCECNSFIPSAKPILLSSDELSQCVKTAKERTEQMLSPSGNVVSDVETQDLIKRTCENFYGEEIRKAQKRRKES